MHWGSWAGAWMVVLAAAQLIGHCPASGQVIIPGSGAGLRTPAPEQETVRGTTSRELIKRFQRGKVLLAEENYAEGTRFVQSVLDGDEDAFFYPDPANRTKERSLKLEAEMLLGQMPAEGLAVYERQHGPAARRLFDAALATHDTDALALVARKYFHTRAGRDAAYHLAADHLDHGRPLTAAVGFERLLAAPGAAAQFDPYLSLKCGASWLRAGMADRTVQVLVALRARSPRKSVTLGGRQQELFDDPAQALAWLTATIGPQKSDASLGLDQWPIAGGDPCRNAQSNGGSPYLNRFWRVSTITGASSSADFDGLITRAIQGSRQPGGASEDALLPFVSTMQPLLVDQLVVVRSIGDVRAYDLTSGRLVWATGEKDPTLLETLRSGGGPQAQQAGSGPLSMLLANRCSEDATFGTLSSDGEFVFAIEDLALSPGVAISLARGQPIHDYNRLVAYDLKTGRAMWEVGGPRGDASDELSGTHFLGAPLVLDRRLYCLGESGSEIRLLVVDPQTGRLDWSQTLNTSSPSEFDMFVPHRQSGLSPSSSGDVLLCPIGPEQVVAMSLARRSLSWRYRFKDSAEMYRAPQLQAPRGVNFQAQQALSFDQNRWLDSQAIIADVRVIVTPHGSNDLYCLNLLDGTLVWKKPRGEGLFVAGVHQNKVLVVGRSYVQALKIEDGEPAWLEPASIPAPSGRGFVAGDFLHLPLATSGVATIGISDGRIVAQARSLNGNVSGNLIAVRGWIVSQGPDFVEAFRQLDALEAEIAATLAKTPNDAEALALRGEIRLQRGNTALAYADLKRALELKSDATAVRSLLVGSLLEGMRVDYESYRRLEPEIEGLLHEPQERSTYLLLRAMGQKRSSDLKGAMAAFLRFADRGVSDRELDRVDGALVVRRDRFVQARAAEIHADAGPLIRREIDADVRARVAELRDQNDPAAIRRFLQYFSGISSAPELERLSAEGSLDGDSRLAEELRLEGLQGSGDIGTVASANARLVELLLAAGRSRDALVCLRRLEQAGPEGVRLDGVAGTQLAAAWRTSADLQKELALEARWPEGQIEVEKHDVIPNAGVAQRSFELPLIGDRGRFFNDASVQISFNWRDCSARDALGRQLWKISLDTPMTQMPQFSRAYVCGHFVLLSVGAQVLAVDVLGTGTEPGPRLLWQMSLGWASPRAGGIRRMGRPVPGQRPMPLNQDGEPVGVVGPVLREQVTLLSGRRLMALDPISGKQLWTREGIRPGTELFGDSRLLYAVGPDEIDAIVFNAVDGTLLGSRRLPPKRQRKETIGSRIVTWGLSDNRQILSLHDPWTGTDLWSHNFEDTADAVVIESDEAFVLEPSGKVSCVTLADGKVRFVARAEAEPQLSKIHVIRSRDEYVLIANEWAASPTGWQEPVLGAIPVKGRAYGYDRQTGKRLWTTPIDRQGIDLRQPAHVPVLTFVCRFDQPRTNGPPGIDSQFGLTILDKRNGRLVFDNRDLKEQILFIEYTGDADQKLLELRLLRSVVRLTFTDMPFPDE